MSKAKVLEWWRPPADAGMPIGCLTTTYGVDMDLLHKHALGGFLDIQADPDEEELQFHIAFEEAAVQCDALVLFVDGAHVQSSIPSWRLDVVPVRRTTMHAKVTLLIWAKHIRILVGSNNLTNDGYRHNREHVSALDFDAAGTNRVLLEEMFNWFQELGHNHADEAILNRMNSLLHTARRVSSTWVEELLPEGTALHWAFTGPGHPNLADQIDSRLRENESIQSWKSIHIVSPFYVAPDSANTPLERLLSMAGMESTLLRIQGRGSSETPAEFEGPESLRKRAKSLGFRPQFYVSKAQTGDDKMARQLHAKLLIVRSENATFGVHGSSNFTNQGWGFARNSNIEANIFLLAPSESNLMSTMTGWWDQMPSDHIGESPIFQAQTAAGDEREDELEILPLFFHRALWTAAPPVSSITLMFLTAERMEGNWRVDMQGSRTITDRTVWEKAGRPSEMTFDLGALPWDHVLRVRSEEGAGWDWPTATDDATLLPPPAELNHMGLEDLMRFFANNLSMRSVILRLLARQQYMEESGTAIAPELDPHRRVDTTAFLLQRTRRISFAFDGLKVKLSRAFYTEQQLDWMLNGPLGPIAFATAIVLEHDQGDEQGFLLAELAFELSEVQIPLVESAIPATYVTAQIMDVIQRIHRLVPKRKQIKDDAMWDYIQRTFDEAQSHVSV